MLFFSIIFVVSVVNVIFAASIIYNNKEKDGEVKRNLGICVRWIAVCAADTCCDVVCIGQTYDSAC